MDVTGYRLALAEAVNTISKPVEDAPNIVGSGEGLWLDEAQAGNVREVLTGGRLRRLDPLFEVLKKRREDWKARHPGEPHPGCAVLWFDRSTPLVVFKSAFQTAAFAGYPNLAVAVKPQGSSDGTVAYLSFDAIVPFPNGAEPSAIRLHIDYLASHEIQVAWQAQSHLIRMTSLDDEAGPRDTRLTLLSERMRTEWQRYGGHQAADDHGFDQATLHLSNDLDLATAVRVMDAMYEPKRYFLADGKKLVVPAFSVSFAVN